MNSPGDYNQGGLTGEVSVLQTLGLSKSPGEGITSLRQSNLCGVSPWVLCLTLITHFTCTCSAAVCMLMTPQTMSSDKNLLPGFQNHIQIASWITYRLLKFIIPKSKHFNFPHSLLYPQPHPLLFAFSMKDVATHSLRQKLCIIPDSPPPYIPVTKPCRFHLKISPSFHSSTAIVLVDTLIMFYLVSMSLFLFPSSSSSTARGMDCSW